MNSFGFLKTIYLWYIHLNPLIFINSIQLKLILLRLTVNLFRIFIIITALILIWFFFLSFRFFYHFILYYGHILFNWDSIIYNISLGNLFFLGREIWRIRFEWVAFIRYTLYIYIYFFLIIFLIILINIFILSVYYILWRIL
jgi:hypothetical protein